MSDCLSYGRPCMPNMSSHTRTSRSLPSIPIALQLPWRTPPIPTFADRPLSLRDKLLAFDHESGTKRIRQEHIEPNPPEIRSSLDTTNTPLCRLYLSSPIPWWASPLWHPLSEVASQRKAGTPTHRNKPYVARVFLLELIQTWHNCGG